MKDNIIYRYNVIGSFRISNILWALSIFFGSSYFFKLSYESFLISQTTLINSNLITDKGITFFPQGLVMGFYSLLGLAFSFYSFLSILLKIGYGFNEFNRKEKIIRIFRWGFPGKNRRIEACYSLNDVKSIKILSGSQKTICLSLKGDLDIVLIRESFFESLNLLEDQATTIADFLGVPLIYS